MTTWESDQRPACPCVVCGGVPDGRIELPPLAAVHVAFDGSAICDPCRSAGDDGDAALLQQRAELGWSEDPQPVPDLVRLVLAACGHPPPPRPVRPPAPPLSGPDAARWARIEPLVYDGPAYEVVVRGSIEHSGDGHRSVTLVLLAGSRARLSDEHGLPWLITDGVTMWRRGESGMVAGEYRGPEWAGQGSELARHRSREDVELFGFGQPIGPVEPIEYLGRPAWRFAFAAPSHKPNDMHVVVDAATGLILEKRFGEASIARWTQFISDEPADPALFVWDGPATSQDELRAADRRDHEADMARRKAWFSEHVTARPLSTSGGPIAVMLQRWDDDGSFEASLDGGVDGALARRPRSSEWWNLGWSQVSHRWSDERWDWALSVRDDEPGLDADRVATLIRALS